MLRAVDATSIKGLCCEKGVVVSDRAEPGAGLNDDDDDEEKALCVGAGVGGVVEWVDEAVFFRFRAKS